jgi:cellulose synthase/poly-beta-1,6-N-acetylglucosamine synthase-like glycosyltransferase
MTVNLRLSLAVFSVGFAIQAAGDAYALAVGNTTLGHRELLLLLGPAFTVLGLLFLWVGRHEWNELHRQRVRHAHLSFFASLVFLALAVTPLAWAAVLGYGSLPLWAHVLFAVGIAGTFSLTFLTYALTIFHLIGPAAKAAVILGFLWAVGVAFLIAAALDQRLSTIVSAVLQRSLSFGTVFSPVSALEAYLIVTYLIFLAAFVHAHRRIVRGVPTGTSAGDGGTPG